MFLDVIIILQLVILEGLLSFDNALVLASMVSTRLKDPKDQKKALTYGIWGAYFFRIIIIFLGTWLMQHNWIKFLAGGYLVYISVHELFFAKEATEKQNTGFSVKWLTPLWSTIVSVELIDLMFSIDSIAVALALSSKKWVLITGAVLGIVMMRFAANFFIKLIDRFPILNPTAFVLVLIAGVNIVLHTFGIGINEHVLPIILFSIFGGALFWNWKCPEKFKKHVPTN
jgi:YkoY family integral membrane protein